MVEKRMEIQIDGDPRGAINASRAVQKEFDKTSKSLEAVSRKMQSIGKTMTLGLTLPLAAAGGAAIKFAMDAEESENLFEVSMGNMADAARDWSVELSDALGLNQYEIRKTISTFNVMFDSMGIGTQKAFDMSKGLTELAYDMASFYNLRPEEAFRKIRAGITGEIEPLKRLGILISETTIQQWAWNNGLVATGEQLTEQEKVLARYGAIMDQTAKAQGDMARTMDSATNQLRQLKSNATEVAIEFGKELLPIFTDAVDKLGDLVEWFGSLSKSQKETVVQTGLILAGIGPLSWAMGGLVKTVSTLTKGMQGLNAALGTTTAVTMGSLGVIAAGAVATGEAVYNYVDATKKAKEGTAEWYDYLSFTGVGILSKPVVELTKLFKEYRNESEETVEVEEKHIENLQLEKVEMQKSAEGLKIRTERMNEATEAVKEQTKSIGDLLESMFELYNLNQSVTENTWDYEEAQKALSEVTKEHAEDSKEYQEALFGLQDAREDLITSIWEEISAEDVSIQRQGELRQQFIEVAREAVASGEITEQAFKDMLAEFENTANGVIRAAGNMVKGINSQTSRIRTDIPINVSYNTSGMPSQPGRRTDTGGSIFGNTFSSDLSIPLVKGEAVLPKSVVKAIKENQPSFAGLDMGDGGVVNNFNIASISVREEADIDRIAQSLYDMQQTRARLA